MTDTLVLKNKLVMPQQGTYLELDQDEMEYVDGGGRIILGLTFTWGAVISSSIIGTIIGFCTGYMTTKAAKLGAMIGGFWGGVAGFIVGGLISAALASVLNKVLHPGGLGELKVDIINVGWAGPNVSYHFDIGNLFGIIGYIGGYGGGAAAVVTATSMGAARAAAY